MPKYLIDADFSSRGILADPPPKVIHIRTGNMTLKEFYSFLSAQWEAILALSETHKLVNVYRDHLEGIQ